MSRVRQAVYILGLLFWHVQVTAEEQQSGAPSMELLEFLGDAEQIDGEWIDPLNMVELQDDQQQVSAPPETETLEFLADEEKLDGKWVGPVNMIEMQTNEQQVLPQEKQAND